MRIVNVRPRQIFDSQGEPTVEVDIVLENGVVGRASVPSGVSMGSNEALEKRDDNKKEYHGKGVKKAVENIANKIAPLIINYNVTDQEKIDQEMIDLDGTKNKERMGSNAILAVSIACAKAAAGAVGQPLHEYIHNIYSPDNDMSIPVPMVNMINGGKHGNYNVDILEFMVIPAGAEDITDALRITSEIYSTLGKLLDEAGYQTTLGLEGGYAPRLKRGNSEALDFIVNATEKSGYSVGKEVFLGVDIAAPEFFDGKMYNLKNDQKELSTDEMIEWLINLSKKYNLSMIEDGLDENDWEGWHKLTQKLGSDHLIVGDDIFVTNIDFIKKGIKSGSANAVIIKPNQVGTLTETFQAYEEAREFGWKCIISHRSHETEDASIAQIAVGLGNGLLKTGAIARSERVAKYNELLRIQENFNNKNLYAGKDAITPKTVVSPKSI